MEFNYENFLELISAMINKTGEFEYWRYGPDEIARSQQIDKNPIEELQFHLKDELQYISKLFELDDKSSIVISALLMQYHLRKHDELYFITIDNLASTLCLKVPEFLSFDSTICNLENENIIQMKDLDLALIKKIEVVDQSVDFSELLENFSSAEQNKTYEFTSKFINKIINL